MPIPDHVLHALPRLAATPANPPAGTMLLYFKTDGRLYRLDENGLEVEVRTQDVDIASGIAFGL